jgi:tRNA pseudouridine13 synthase
MQQYDIEFPRAHGEPICSGRTKVHAEDFEVIENLGFEPSGSGEHLYVNVRKTDANTAWVAGKLADFVGIRRNDVGYAGRKDRRAVATQWFSCWLPGRQDPEWQNFRAEGVEILATSRHLRKLKRGNLVSNAFRIIVRDVPEQA